MLRIAGLPAVSALFQRRPERVLRLFYEDRMVPKVGAFCRLLAAQRRPYRCLDPEEMARVAGTVRHGGVVAITPLPAITELNWQTARLWAERGEPLVILDGVGNPHNLGAIARSLAFWGFRHLLLSDHPAQAGLSDAAYRIAEGGLEYLSVHRISGLPAQLPRLSTWFRCLATGLGRGLGPEALGGDPRPPALLLGNEEDGLPAATQRACEAVITLRGTGAIQSLNVAATAAILAYVLRPSGTAKGAAPAGRAKARPARPKPGRIRPPP